jgi:hypothetical protein
LGEGIDTNVAIGPGLAVKVAASVEDRSVHAARFSVLDSIRHESDVGRASGAAHA